MKGVGQPYVAGGIEEQAVRSIKAGLAGGATISVELLAVGSNDRLDRRLRGVQDHADPVIA